MWYPPIRIQIFREFLTDRVFEAVWAKLAKLRREIIEPKSGGGGGKGEGFDVARTGDARVGFVGFPSVGKSTLLSNLAGVYSEVAAYEFTTLTTVPGVIRYKVKQIVIILCRVSTRTRKIFEIFYG